MKKITVAFLATLSPVFAQTVTVSSVGGFTGQFLSGTGAVLPFGSLVRVGSFDLSGSNLSVIQASSDFQEINALFTPLAEGEANSGTVVQQDTTGSTLIINNQFGAGNSFGQITGTSAAYTPPQTDLFFWILNSADGASSTEWAIAGSTSNDFKMPQSPGATTLTPLAVDIIYRGIKSGDNVLLGPVVIVPEPSSALLVTISLGFLLGRRRR